MSTVIQHKGLTAQLFSSALFCLWLSTASLAVWLGMDGAGAGPAATATGKPVQAPVIAPAKSLPQAATPASDGGRDAA